MEGAEGAPAAQHESCAAKGVARLPQEVQLVLQGHVWTIIGSHALQVLLDFLDVLPNGLRHCREVLVQLTAVIESHMSTSKQEEVLALHNQPWGTNPCRTMRVTPH